MSHVYIIKILMSHVCVTKAEKRVYRVDFKGRISEYTCMTSVGYGASILVIAETRNARDRYWTQVKVYPYEKGGGGAGAEKVLAVLKGEAHKVLG